MAPASVIALLILCQGTAAIAPQAEGQASCSAPDCQEQNLRPSASDEHSLLNLAGKVRNHEKVFNEVSHIDGTNMIRTLYPNTAPSVCPTTHPHKKLALWSLSGRDSCCNVAWSGGSCNGVNYIDGTNMLPALFLMRKYNNGANNDVSKADAADLCAQNGQRLCNDEDVHFEWNKYIKTGVNFGFYAWVDSASGGSGCILHGPTSNTTSARIACGYAETNTYNALCCQTGGMRLYNGGSHNSLNSSDASDLCADNNQQLCSKAELNAEWDTFKYTVSNTHFYGRLRSGTGCIYHGPRAMGRQGTPPGPYTWTKRHAPVPTVACGYPDSRTYNALCCPSKGSIIASTLPNPTAASLRQETSTSTASCLDLSITADLNTFAATECYAGLHGVCSNFSTLPSGTSVGDCLAAAVCLYGRKKWNRDNGLCGVCEGWLDRCDYNDGAGKFVYNYAADTGRRRDVGFDESTLDGRRRVSADWENAFPGKLPATTDKPCTVCGKMKCEDANEITCKSMGMAEKYCEWDGSSRSCVTKTSTYASLASTDETLVRKSGDC